MPILLKLFIAQIILISCSTVQFNSSQEIPVSFTEEKTHTHDIKIKVSKPFYLWGLIPNKQEVLLDQELKSNGVKSASSVQINEVGADVFNWTTILSLGMYSKRTYEILAKAIK